MILENQKKEYYEKQKALKKEQREGLGAIRCGDLTSDSGIKVDHFHTASGSIESPD
jgi:hypothetical protein